MNSVAPGLGALPEADGANQTGKSGGGAHLAGGGGVSALDYRPHSDMDPFCSVIS